MICASDNVLTSLPGYVQRLWVWREDLPFLNRGVEFFSPGFPMLSQTFSYAEAEDVTPSTPAAWKPETKLSHEMSLETTKGFFRVFCPIMFCSFSLCSMIFVEGWVNRFHLRRLFSSLWMKQWQVKHAEFPFSPNKGSSQSSQGPRWESGRYLRSRPLKIHPEPPPYRKDWRSRRSCRSCRSQGRWSATAPAGHGLYTATAKWSDDWCQHGRWGGLCSQSWSVSAFFFPRNFNIFSQLEM